jgi:3-oxoacyl-[acyl-carrier protein] reductase
MDLNLSGKRALVCGSSDGIGKATAQELASLGANIVLLARNAEKLEAVKQELNADSGQQHTYLVADFGEPETVQNVVKQYLEKNPPFHILINNTGGPPAGKAHLADPSEYLDAFSRHLMVNHRITQTVLEGMKKTGYGRIVNVISTSVKAPLPNLGVSNTIRGAVGNWSKTLANELGMHNITVNNVLPGATETGRLKSIIANKAQKMGLSEDDVSKEMTAEIPMARFAQPREVANAIAFLASPAAGYINGINIPVDGGRTPNL